MTTIKLEYKKGELEKFDLRDLYLFRQCINHMVVLRSMDVPEFKDLKEIIKLDRKLENLIKKHSKLKVKVI